MSRLFFCLLFLTIASTSFSQKVYFIYLQSEGAEPFFIKMGEKTLSSTSGGYLILSELKDSSYQFKVGFPQNKWPDQQFAVEIKSKDRGFLLKNFGDKGWGLFDLQTLSVQMAAQGNASMQKRELRELSAFTEVLSKAANDPSLRYKPEFAVTRTEEKELAVNQRTASTRPPDTVSIKPASSTLPAPGRAEPVAASLVPTEDSGIKKSPEALGSKNNPSKPDTAYTNTSQPTLAAEGTSEKDDVNPVKQQGVQSEQENVKQQPVYARSRIVKKSESSTTDGFGLTFIDQSGSGELDTIQILIPNPPAVLSKNEPEKDRNKFLEITDEERDGKPLGAKAGSTATCSSSGTQSDFLKLRKKMAGHKAEDAMIEEAKKGFKAKCYSTEQIKNLGNLFLNEAGKFQFYEAVYPYSTDRNNFAALQSELKDNYFIHRFRNLVKPGNL